MPDVLLSSLDTISYMSALLQLDIIHRLIRTVESQPPVRSLKNVVLAVSLSMLAGFAVGGQLSTELLANENDIGESGHSAADSGGSERELPKSASYLELGLVLGDFRAVTRYFDSDNPFVSPYLEGALYWKALFAEARRGLAGENYGVTLWQDEQWTLDLIAASPIGTLNTDDKGVAESESERTKRVYERDTFLVGSGFRISRYTGQGLLRFQLLGDVYDNNGFGARLHLGRRWQFGNWEARTLVGASWLSDRTADYLFGIDADEATASLPAIEIDQMALLEFDLSFSYPLSKHWVLHADAAFNRYDGSIGRSALVDRVYDSEILARIGYVF